MGPGGGPLHQPLLGVPPAGPPGPPLPPAHPFNAPQGDETFPKPSGATAHPPPHPSTAFPRSATPGGRKQGGKKKKNNKNLIQITPNLSEKEAKEAEKRSATGPGRGTHGSLVPPVPAGGVRAPGRAGEGGCPRRGGGWQGRQWA